MLQRHAGVSKRVLLLLFFYHSLLALVYYVYALSNPSDSKAYFYKASVKYLGDNWLDYYGVSTAFIDFLSFFVVNRLGLNYEGAMALFAWLGYLGFVFFYVLLSEKVRYDPKIWGIPATIILLFLPNLHFWSSSLGKGSVIFLGFGLFFFGLNQPTARWLALLIGGWIIFQVRPHIFYVTLIAVGLGYTFSSAGIKLGYRLVVVVISVFLLNLIYTDVLRLTGLEDDSVLDPFISHRAAELSKATSGIDITNYSIPEKLFAFWFRPLFYDAPGALGIIVSFENLFYLLFFTQLLRPRAWAYLLRSEAIIKTALLTFLGVSVALAQISGNLGLAMRQKSQVMLLMLFVILKYRENVLLARKQLRLRLKALQKTQKQTITQTR
ncbi:MAG: hypothetical protein KatS3mg032_0012 [Cyclobacteriaceae bacterium]|nr:MAG: hypothetical protein KatS3mg032_0012 [Cyclobacteriaceae bacterium]